MNSPKITFIGAGSTVFTKNLVGDILSFEELAGAEIALHDIDPERLRTSEIVVSKIAQALKVPAKITNTTNRREALDGADFVICTIQVGGYEPATVIDFEIPSKYGLRQTIGDTLGIGGIMRGLRTIPVFQQIAKDMEELCPDALFLNYVNPMAINTWAWNGFTDVPTVGLCHSVQTTLSELAFDLQISMEEIDYQVAGINHMAFFLRLEKDGESLYPLLEEFAKKGNWSKRGEGGMVDHVRYEIFKHFGYFVTESSEHFSEYVPWFIKSHRPDLLDDFSIPLEEYIRRCKQQIADWDALRVKLEGEDAEIDVTRSKEYGSLIIHSMLTDTKRVVYGNVINNGLISNLPADCCVEVPCLVDHNGVQPTKIGKLPSQLAGLMQTNINVQRMTVEAALEKKRDAIYHAAMLDPHTAAELDLNQIRAMVDEMVDAQGDYLKGY